MTGSTPLPSLHVPAPARVLYAVLSFALTFAAFAVLPVFDAIGQHSRPTRELLDVPVVAAPPPAKTEHVTKPPPKKRPKPKLRARNEIRAIEPLGRNLSLETALTLPMTSLQPGLGDVSVDFGIVAPSAPVSKAPPPPPTVPFTVRDLDAPPRLLVPVKPLYPLRAKQRRIEGYVDIEFQIEPNGEVKTVKVIESEPPGVFDDSACNAARRWRFSVPRKEGKAVKVLARQRIQFRLGKK